MLLTILSVSEFFTHNNLRCLILMSDVFVFLFLMISELKNDMSISKLLIMSFCFNAFSFSMSIIDGVTYGWLNRNFIFYADLLFIIMMFVNGCLVFYILYKFLKMPIPSEEDQTEGQSQNESQNEKESIELSQSSSLIFNTYITIPNEEKDMCLICLSDINLNKGLNVDVLHTICGHVFHNECLKKWLQEKKQCPKCRMDL
jgi:hypothetical protein